MRELVDRMTRVPRTCTWELTLRCNLDCGHCGSHAGRARPDEMDHHTALRVVDELADLGCEKVSLSGGEPSLSPYWADVAFAGTRAGMRMNMIVNGAHHDRDFIRQAKDAGLVNLGVSLDGLGATHDRGRRSEGLFKKVDRFIEDCAALNMPIGVITTVWKPNLFELEAIHDYLVGRTFAWQIQLGAAMGNLQREDQLVPSDLLDLIPRLAHLVDRKQVKMYVADNIGYFGPYEERIRKHRSSPLPCWVGCYAGCKHVGIQADGGVKGCLSMQSVTATEGNLHHQSLTEIWNQPGAFAYTRAFDLDDLAGFCRTCAYAEICRGGCLSMRTCEGGRENPFCYHRVATLAALQERKSKSRYTPTVYAPAALLLLLGFSQPGCIENNDLYGGPTPNLVDAYGVPIGDAFRDTLTKDVPPMVDAYGVPIGDALRDTLTKDVPIMVDVYGIPRGDAYLDRPPPIDAAPPADTDAAKDIVHSVDAQDQDL